MCIIAGICGAFLRYLTAACGQNRLGGAIRAVINSVILAMLLSVFTGAGKSKIPALSLPKSPDYSNLGEATIQEILTLAEEKCGKAIADRLEGKFGITGASCAVSLDPETYRPTKIILHIPSGTVFSGYAIRNDIQEEFGILPEVNQE